MKAVVLRDRKLVVDTLPDPTPELESCQVLSRQLDLYPCLTTVAGYPRGGGDRE